MSYDLSTLLQTHSWKPIPERSGRFVLEQGISYQSPQELAESEIHPMEYPKPPPGDVIMVLRVEGGGLISYRKLDGSYRHTLNNDEGFTAKLLKLGLDPGEV